MVFQREPIRRGTEPRRTGFIQPLAVFRSGLRGMLSVCKLAAGAFVTLALYPALVLAAFIIHCTTSVVPPGIDQPLKLRIYHILFISVFFWGTVLEKLRLGRFLSILRVVTSGLPSFRDSSLLIEDKKFDDVPVRVYQPKTPATAKRKAFVFFHGGAGIFGCVESYERILRHITKEADSVVVAVEYGLGPENPYPNQYDQCFKATVHFMKHVGHYHVDASRISIGGDSCGANFATRICQLLVERPDLPKVQAQVLIYPGLQGMDFYLPSYQQNSKVPLMWRDTVIYFCCLFLNKSTSVIKDVLESCHVPEDIRLKYRKWVNADLVPKEFRARGYKPQAPGLYQFKPEVYQEMKEILQETFSPLFAQDEIIRKLPQTYILTCEFDVLRDDGLLYKRRLEGNGVPVTWTHIENGIHGIAVLYGYGFLSFPSVERMVNDFTAFIKSL